jgi:hypothetical protein
MISDIVIYYLKNHLKELNKFDEGVDLNSFNLIGKKCLFDSLELLLFFTGLEAELKKEGREIDLTSLIYNLEASFNIQQLIQYIESELEKS